MFHIKLITFVHKRINGLRKKKIQDYIVLIVVVNYEQKQGLGEIDYEEILQYM